MDSEFYDSLDKFVEDLVASLPASYDDAIVALERKANDLQKKIAAASLRQSRRASKPGDFSK